MRSHISVVALTLIVQCLSVTRPVSGACPLTTDEAIQEIAACIPRFNQIMDFTKTSAGAIEAYCATGAEQETKCIDRFNEDCRRTNWEISRHFDEFVNSNGVREAVGVVCRTENIDALIANMTCIGFQQEGVNRCLTDQLRRTKSEQSAINQEADSKGQRWLVGQERSITCEFQDEMKKCQSPYRQNCGDRIGDIFDAIHSAYLPPMCGTVAIKQSLPSLVTALLLSAVFVVRS